MLSLCLCLVWKFANHWSKQRGCCWLSGDMKGGKMEPCQRAACRRRPWASTAGCLSSPPALADVTISGVWAVCTSSYLAVCSLTRFSALQITLGENLQPVSPLRGHERRQSRRGDRAGSAVIYLWQSYTKSPFELFLLGVWALSEVWTLLHQILTTKWMCPPGILPLFFSGSHFVGC